MIEIQGEFQREWDRGYDAIVCTTNTTLKGGGNLVMGAGIAKWFATTFPYLQKEWGTQVAAGYKGVMVSNKIIDPYLIALPTKREWQRPSQIEWVIQGCQELQFLANAFWWKRILMTRPGCGNGGLLWEDVKPAISFLDDSFVVISNV